MPPHFTLTSCPSPLTIRLLQLFAALSETLTNQVRVVTAEKKEMIQEAQRIITLIRQMEASLDDSKPRREFQEDGDLKVTFPLSRCLQYLKEKHMQINRLHKDRFEQVKSQSPPVALHIPSICLSAYDL